MKKTANRCGVARLTRRRIGLRRWATMMPILIGAVLLMVGLAHDIKAGDSAWMSLLMRLVPCLLAVGAWLMSKRVTRSSRLRRNAVSTCCIALALGLGYCAVCNQTLSSLGVVLLTATAVVVSALAAYALHGGGHVAAVVMGGVMFILLMLATSLQLGGMSAALIVIIIVAAVFLCGLFGCWFSPPPDFWGAVISVLLLLGSVGLLLLGVFFLDDRLLQYLTIHLRMDPIVPDGIRIACTPSAWSAVLLLLMLIVSLCVASGVNRHRGLSRWLDIGTLSALCAALLISTSWNLGVRLFVNMPLYGADLLTNTLTLLGIVHISLDERPEPPLALSMGGTYLLEKLDRETGESSGKIVTRKVDIFDCKEELLRLFCRDYGAFRIERADLAGALLRKTEGMLMYYQGETEDILELLPEVHCSYGSKVYVLVCGKDISPVDNLLLVGQRLKQALSDRSDLKLAICADDAVGTNLIRVLLLFL